MELQAVGSQAKSTKSQNQYKNSFQNQDDNIAAKLMDLRNALVKKGKVTEEEAPVSDW